MDGCDGCCRYTFFTFTDTLTPKRINSVMTADPGTHRWWLKASRHTPRSQGSARHKDHSANLISIVVMHLLLSAHLVVLMDGADISWDICGSWVCLRRLWRCCFSCWSDCGYWISCIFYWKSWKLGFQRLKLLNLDHLKFGQQTRWDFYTLLKWGLRPDSQFLLSIFSPVGVTKYHTLGVQNMDYGLTLQFITCFSILSTQVQTYEVLEYIYSHCCCCWPWWNALWDSVKSPDWRIIDKSAHQVPIGETWQFA